MFRPLTYDRDPRQAMRTRGQMLEMCAEDRVQIMAYHFPWPGIGHVSRSVNGFRFHATAMEIVTVPDKTI